MNIKPTNPRVGIKYVEQRFSRHRNTIRRWIAAGKFPPPAFDPSGCQTWRLDAWEAKAYTDINPRPENAKAALSARGVS